MSRVWSMVCGAVSAFVAGEVAAWATTRNLAQPSATVSAIVLGCPSRPDHTISASQAWRVAILLRSAPCHTVVFSGGSVRTVDGKRVMVDAPSEAQVMSQYAIAQGLAANVVLEEGSLTTHQNLANSLALIPPSHQIMLISSPVHAARARRYLRELSPTAADRLVAPEAYRFGERLLLKLVTASYEVGVLVRFLGKVVR